MGQIDPGLLSRHTIRVRLEKFDDRETADAADDSENPKTSAEAERRNWRWLPGRVKPLTSCEQYCLEVHIGQSTPSNYRDVSGETGVARDIARQRLDLSPNRMG